MRVRIIATGSLSATLLVGIALGQSTERVSVDSSGSQGDRDSIGRPAISADGRFVAFESAADNLVAGDTNARVDVFVRDRSNATTECVDLNLSGYPCALGADSPVLSDDGRFVAFASSSSDLVTGDTNGRADIFVRDRQTGVTERVSVDSSGTQSNLDSRSPSISSDGRFVVFTSSATNLVPGDVNGFDDVFVHDRQTGSTQIVSVDSAGNQGNDRSEWGSISADGGSVAFTSRASNLVPGDTNGVADMFVCDLQSGTTERVSVDSSGVQGNGDSSVQMISVISANGRFVTFESVATNLVANDQNGHRDVFVHDRQTGTTERASVSSAGGEANDECYGPAFSANGRFVTFYSRATSLVRYHGSLPDVFVHDLETGATTCASVDSAGNSGDGEAVYPEISADGRFVAFTSKSTNLVTGDTNGKYDEFVHDFGPPVPVVTSVTPDRTPTAGASVVIRGSNFLVGTATARFSGQPGTSLQVIDDMTIQCTAPAGVPGPATVTVQNGAGSTDLDGGFTYTPAVLWTGDATPGGSVSIDYLGEPLDGVFAIVGVPPAVAIPTPPFQNQLCIAPFTIVFVLPPLVWPFDQLTLAAQIPDDAKFSGVTLLLQALIGPSFKQPKDAAWTNCAELAIQ